MAEKDRLLHEKCLDSSDWLSVQEGVGEACGKSEDEHESGAPAKARARAMLQASSVPPDAWPALVPTPSSLVLGGQPL